MPVKKKDKKKGKKQKFTKEDEMFFKRKERETLIDLIGKKQIEPEQLRRAGINPSIYYLASKLHALKR